MAHIPAERCLGIIELLADGARDNAAGRNRRAPRRCRKAARIGCLRRSSTSAGPSRIATPASTGSRCASPCSASGSTSRPAFPTSASRCSIVSRASAASSRASPSSTATGSCGSRTRRVRRGGLVYQPARDDEYACRCTPRPAARRGSRRFAAEDAIAERAASNGGFDARGPLRPERASIDRGAVARAARPRRGAATAWR